MTTFEYKKDSVMSNDKKDDQIPGKSARMTFSQIDRSDHVVNEYLSSKCRFLTHFGEVKKGPNFPHFRHALFSVYDQKLQMTLARH